MKQNAHEMVLSKEDAAKLAHLAAIPFPNYSPVISTKEFKDIFYQNEHRERL